MSTPEERLTSLPHAVLREPVVCSCGGPGVLVSNAVVYGRIYGNGLVWVCSRRPDCQNRVGAHPDGTPYGTLCDDETRKLRRLVHTQFDPLWQSAKHPKSARNRVYAWLARKMELTDDECHVGKFSKEQCLRALEILEVRSS